MGLIYGMLSLDGWPVSKERFDKLLRSSQSSIYAETRSLSSSRGFFGFRNAPFDRGKTEAQSHVASRASIVFDGRLDNRDDLLRLLGIYVSRAISDAALALAVYETMGPDGLRQLVGDWSLAIWDTQQRQLLLGSDFAGVRPLYYYADSTMLVWSTELKSLVKFVGPGEISDRYAAGFLILGGVPDLTPYPGINSLRPGSYLLRSADRTEIRPFWVAPIEKAVRYRSERDYEERLRELFQDAVGSRLRSDAPILAELSGGLDSSSIVCMTKWLLHRSLTAEKRIVTLSYEHAGSIDKRFFAAVEEWTGFESVHLSTAIYPFVSSDNPGDMYPEIWRSLTQRVAEEAERIGAQTLLTGIGGDWIMGNYYDDTAQVASLIGALHIGAALRRSFEWSRTNGQPLPSILWRAFLTLLPASTTQSWRDLYTERDDADQETGCDLVVPAFRSRINLPPLDQLLSRDWMHAPPDRRKRIRGLTEIVELRTLQTPAPLLHLDRTHPYLHRPLVEFMMSIPSEIVCRPREPRRLMRSAFRDLWPRELRSRRSKDVFDGVFLESLAPLVPELARNARMLQVVERGYIDPTHLIDALERLGRSPRCNAGQLQRTIQLELWLRRCAIPPGCSSN